MTETAVVPGNCRDSAPSVADFEHFQVEGMLDRPGTPSVPTLFTQIDGNLWMGGCPVESLPREFKFAFDLSCQAHYFVHAHQQRAPYPMRDSLHEVLCAGALHNLVFKIEHACLAGPTLVHCHAGLNRSGLLVAMVLKNRGMTGQAAIDLLRAKRDRDVLTNEKFEAFVLDRPYVKVNPWMC